MGENWNKKQTVEESRPQWSVIIAILALILLPLFGGLALIYFSMNGASMMVLLLIGGLCLASVALPLLVLISLMRSSRREMKSREDQ